MRARGLSGIVEATSEASNTSPPAAERNQSKVRMCQSVGWRRPIEAPKFTCSDGPVRLLARIGHLPSPAGEREFCCDWNALAMDVANSAKLPATVDATLAMLGSADYIADRSLATAVHLALHLNRPLFLEGEAGVGKTEIAKVLATALRRRLIRLQCYEGLDVASAVYEWDYARQMIEIRLAEAAEEDRGEIESTIFSDRFLIKRPLLQALEQDIAGPPVLLIDELDRTDEPFEAFLLEILSDFQVTIPEIGTIHAEHPPIVIITSNRTREIHDALKRRCFYYWVDYPTAVREMEILKRKAPGAAEQLSRQVVGFVQKLRGMDLFKLPGIAETIDWTEALMQLDVLELTPQAINDTLGVLLKYQDDIARIQGSEAARLLDQIKAEAAAAAA